MASPISAGQGYEILRWLPVTAPRTHVICTLNPLRANKELVTELVQKGMNVVRINFSHILTSEARDAVTALLKIVREVERELCRPVAIMLDTQGPEFRVGRYEGALTLTEGASLLLSPGEGTSTAEQVFMRIPPGYNRLFDDLLAAWDPANPIQILIDDIKIALEVERILPGAGIYCRVIRGGELLGNKSINFTRCRLQVPAVTKTDLESVDFALETGEFDFVAQSFTTDPGAVTFLRRHMEIKAGPEGRLFQVTKIEDLSGVANMEGIVGVSDAVMIPRGDLRAAVGEFDLPLVQRQMMNAAIEKGVPIVLATDVLASMERGSLPTRSESDNLADAICRGASLIMFSGETASGKNPGLVVETAVKHALAAEKYVGEQQLYAPFRKKAREVFLHEVQALRAQGKKPQQNPDIFTAALALQALELAEEMGYPAFVPCTISGNTARDAHRFFPQVPVIGITSSPRAARRMLLYAGTYPVLVNAIPQDADAFFTMVKGVVNGLNLAQVGQSVVTSVAWPIPRRAGTNMLYLCSR